MSLSSAPAAPTSWAPGTTPGWRATSPASPSTSRDRFRRAPRRPPAHAGFRMGHGCCAFLRRETRSAPPVMASTMSRTMTTKISARTAAPLDAFTAGLLRGNVTVATDDRWRVPLVRPRSARQGPRGNSEPRFTVTASATPGASTAPSVAANGPARRPRGPLESLRLPLRSSVLCPLLRTLATTSAPPAADRFAVRDPISKFEAGAPPGPMERYIRTPARLTSVMPAPAVGGADTSAHTTASRSPDEALRGTLTVSMSNASVCGAKRSVAWVTDVHLESSFLLWPGAKAKVPATMLAADGYTETSTIVPESLSIWTVRVSLIPGARWSTTYTLARGVASDTPGTATRRIPMSPDFAPERLDGDANAGDAATMAPTPTSKKSAVTRPSTIRLRPYATEWVMEAE